MDAKYFAEIKARVQDATPGPWEVKTNRHPETTGEAWGWIRGPRENWCWTDRRSSSRPDAEFVAHARTDIPALLAEVERLTAENHKQFETIGRQGREMNRRDEIIKQQDQQIATLKVEAERLTEENESLDKEYRHYRHLSEKEDQQIATLNRALDMACAELNLSDVEKVFASDYFIQQAQEQGGKP